MSYLAPCAVMQIQNFERRKLRSNQPNRAITFLFRAVADSHDVSHVALADSRGLLLVSHGDPAACDVLAAYGPLLFKTVDPITREHILTTLAQTIEGARPENLSVRRFMVDGEPLFLCILGEPGAAKDVALNRAVSGSRRILAN